MTRTSAQQRAGLSRAAYTAKKAARRTHNDDLISSLFGDVATHFKQNPLDGPDIIGAVPKPQPTGTPGGAPMSTLSADDPVQGQADWFKGSGREGQASSPPKKLAPAAPRKMTVVEAIKAANVSLEASNALQTSEGMMLVELPGDDYLRALDEIPRPPNTF